MTALLLAIGAGLALSGVLLVAWWLRDERWRLREREATAERWEAALRRREAELRGRERALWWAEPGSAQAPALTRPQGRVMA